MLDKTQAEPVKGAQLYLTGTSIVQLQPIIWHRNDAILRQALLSPSDKAEKTPQEKSTATPDGAEKRDLVEAINLYPPGSDGSEYSSELLSELTGAALPTISSSQVSSVLSELEPALAHEASGQPIPSTDKQLNRLQTLRRLEKHETDKGSWYGCRNCGFITIDEGRAREHMGACPGEGGPALSCLGCRNVFRSDAALKAHLLLDHGSLPSEQAQLIAISLIASHSNKQREKVGEREPNEQTERESEKEIKREREKRATKSTTLASIKVEKEPAIRCKVDGCSLRFVSPANMEYHRLCHNGACWKCRECGEEAESWPKLSTHLWKEHTIDMELYSCDQCSYKTNSLSKLMNLHRRIHGDERPFVCNVCTKRFKTTKQLRNHNRSHKKKDKKESECEPDEREQESRDSSCDTCGRRFRCARLLRHHRDIVHRKLKPYLCSDCGHSAASKSSLRLHARQHTGEKPYSCSECDYRTSDHNTLRRHKMRHSGAKRYLCPHCPYASIQSSTFKSHLHNKHPGLDVGLMFSCEVCPFKTVKKENFLAHSSYHSIKPSLNDEDVSNGRPEDGSAQLT